MKDNTLTEKQQQQLREHKRHQRVYKTLRAPVLPIVYRKFRYTCEKAPEIDGNFLVLSNHNTDVDFFFVSGSFKQHMYFVASEHVYQKGTLSKLLKYYFSPIARVKGVNAASTVMNVMRALRSGDNVCIFAEGNRSYNGETCPILFSTGKLARSSGASLVTYRIEGGYLTTPRWAYTQRKGRMYGHVVNVYSPEQLHEMTADEINEAIRTDLYEDAFERQAEWKVPYKGERLAEGLEHILFICPKCGKMSTLVTHDDRISCECGLDAAYDEYGYFCNAPYRTVLEWDRWQKRCLHELIRTADDSELFSDGNVTLYAIDGEHNVEQLETGRLSMTRNAIILGSHSFPLSEIEGLAIYSRCTIVLTHNGTHYEMKTPERMCAVKYTRAYDYIVNEK